MSWFKDLMLGPPLDDRTYIDRPNDPDAYPEEHRVTLRAAPQIIAKRLADEAAILSRLGLPIPRPTTELRFEPFFPPYLKEMSNVNIYLPEFEIPTYCSFKVR